MSDAVFTLHRGAAPLLVSLPHAGTLIPAELKPAYREQALFVPDTDWHVDALYAFAQGLGASVIVPRHSRYVIDLNRPPEDEPMYPGAHNTELVPTHAFDGSPLYRAWRAPDKDEIGRRLEAYWQPYHEALARELARIKAAHGHAVVWEGHSIKSELPWLFEGKLPDLNLGTAGGASCAPSLTAALASVLAARQDFTHAIDGRFKGGYITRHYGRPRGGVHAVQLEMCWSCYMHESPPYSIDRKRAAVLVPVLRTLLETALAWKPDA